jgi:thymidylate synthase ThyX
MTDRREASLTVGSVWERREHPSPWQLSTRYTIIALTDTHAVLSHELDRRNLRIERSSLLNLRGLWRPFTVTT